MDVVLPVLEEDLAAAVEEGLGVSCLYEPLLSLVAFKFSQAGGRVIRVEQLRYNRGYIHFGSFPLKNGPCVYPT